MHPPPRPGSKKAVVGQRGHGFFFFFGGGGGVLFGLGRLGRYFLKFF